mmetsp:Transcript_13112/g.24031  ORF Transcript_13112/g.24031 Transcript_13112/m.24031 type:complete len:98 (-) Transcript_13112:1775-2068(-)
MAACSHAEGGGWLATLAVYQHRSQPETLRKKTTLPCRRHFAGLRPNTHKKGPNAQKERLKTQKERPNTQKSACCGCMDASQMTAKQLHLEPATNCGV